MAQGMKLCLHAIWNYMTRVYRVSPSLLEVVHLCLFNQQKHNRWFFSHVYTEANEVELHDFMSAPQFYIILLDFVKCIVCMLAVACLIPEFMPNG